MNKDKLNSLLILSDTTIKQAMQKLNETAEQILCVTEKSKKLIGTVTDGDIRRGIINGLRFNDKVEKIMYKDFTSVLYNTPKLEEHVESLMIETKLEHIPILNEKGVIVDVILLAEILRGKKHIKPKQLYENRVIIMAGGKGTRLDPFTKILPKPLIPIGNKPVIEIIMEKFYRCGLYKFTYTLNYKKEYLKLFLKENDFPYEIDWIEEDDYLGTAGSLSLIKDKVTDTFWVANCDSILDIDLEQVMKWHKEHKAAMTIVGCHNEVKIPFGVLQLSDGKLSKVLEKPIHDMIVNTGVYIIEPRAISYIPYGKKMDMNELIDTIARKEEVSVFPIYGGWIDVGQWEEYKKACDILKD